MKSHEKILLSEPVYVVGAAEVRSSEALQMPQSDYGTPAKLN